MFDPGGRLLRRAHALQALLEILRHVLELVEEAGLLHEHLLEDREERGLSRAPAQRGHTKIRRVDQEVAEFVADLAGLDVIVLQRARALLAERAAGGAGAGSIFHQLQRRIGIAHHVAAVRRLGHDLRPILPAWCGNRGDRVRRGVCGATIVAAAGEQREREGHNGGGCGKTQVHVLTPWVTWRVTGRRQRAASARALSNRHSR